jgi:hypothetical protein
MAKSKVAVLPKLKVQAVKVPDLKGADLRFLDGLQVGIAQAQKLNDESPSFQQGYQMGFESYNHALKEVPEVPF